MLVFYIYYKAQQEFHENSSQQEFHENSKGGKLEFCESLRYMKAYVYKV